VAPNTKSARRAREIEHTRRDIVEAAARVFAEAGFHQATMQAIAREVGFTAASLYTYFKSKDEIFTALVDDLAGALRATFDAPVPAGLTFEQQLELLLQRQFEVAVARRQALRILFDLGPSRRGRGAEQGPVQYLKRLTGFLTAAGAPERLRCTPDEAARVLFGITQATFLPWILESDVEVAEPARHASHVVDLFLRGAGRPGG
jgi:AcrR family transcriptional regulator